MQLGPLKYCSCHQGPADKGPEHFCPWLSRGTMYRRPSLWCTCFHTCPAVLEPSQPTMGYLTTAGWCFSDLSALTRTSTTHSFIYGYYFQNHEHFSVGLWELKSTSVCGHLKKEGTWGLWIETRVEKESTLGKRKGVEEVEEIPGPRVHLDAALSKKAIETRVENLMIWASV